MNPADLARLRASVMSPCELFQLQISSMNWHARAFTAGSNSPGPAFQKVARGRGGAVGVGVGVGEGEGLVVGVGLEVGCSDELADGVGVEAVEHAAAAAAATAAVSIERRVRDTLRP